MAIALFPFHEPDHLGYGVLGRNRDTHVHMVGHQMAFEDLALLLPSQRVKDGTQLTTSLAEDGLPAPFGHENDMILAVPFRITLVQDRLFFENLLLISKDVPTLGRS